MKSKKNKKRCLTQLQTVYEYHKQVRDFIELETIRELSKEKENKQVREKNTKKTPKSSIFR